MLDECQYSSHRYALKIVQPQVHDMIYGSAYVEGLCVEGDDVVHVHGATHLLA